MIDAGRRKIADRVSPDPAMVQLTEVRSTSETTVIEPAGLADYGTEALGDGLAGQQRAGGDAEAVAVSGPQTPSGGVPM